MFDIARFGGLNVKIFGFPSGGHPTIAKMNLSVIEDSVGIIERFPRFRPENESQAVVRAGMLKHYIHVYIVYYYKCALYTLY